MKKKLILAISLTATLIIKGYTGISQAATISGLCVTEPEFTNYTTMDLAAIRQFLIEKGGFLAGRAPLASPPDYTFTDVDGNPTDAALEIHNGAQTNKINPRVLLATLEKEKGAATRVTRLPDDDLKLIAGWGSGSATAREQIRQMAEQFRRDFYDRLSQCSSTLGGWQIDVVKLRSKWSRLQHACCRQRV